MTASPLQDTPAFAGDALDRADMTAGIAATTPPNTAGCPDGLRIANTVLEVVVLPGKGADIYSIIDRATGIDVLFKSPWGYQDPATLEPTDDSMRDWLAAYPGGWQQLIPNAGEPRIVDGVLRGYHGEAAISGWQVEAHARNAVRLTTRLRGVPLFLTRTLTLDGGTLHVRDTVTNESPEHPLDVMWVQHPSFGAPFVDEHARLDFGARTMITDATNPGTGLTPDTRLGTEFDPANDPALGATCSEPAYDPPRDLRSVPSQGSGVAAFGCLTDFDAGWFTIQSPSAGFGIRIDWDAAVFPHAWFWQECHASSGFPWYRRAYVIAVEPANVLPGSPSPGCPARGVTPMLYPGQQWTSTLTLTRTALQPPANDRRGRIAGV